MLKLSLPAPAIEAKRMKTLTRIDGHQRELRDSPIVLWETKSVPARHWSASAWSGTWNGHVVPRLGTFLQSPTWFHGVPWLVIGVLTLLVPGFFLALVGLLAAVAVALVGFIVLIQLPLRYLVRCWQQQPEPESRAAQNDSC